MGSLFIGFHRKFRAGIIIIVLILIGFIFVYSAWDKTYIKIFNYLKISILFLFHIVVTFRIIQQIWQAKLVNKNVIFGVISGFISLGLIGFFICLSIEFINPGSFSGLSVLNSTVNTLTERLMYFSYITLLTIGYGDITPITPMAQKASIFIGLMGQFYMVIITAIIVGKYISQSNKEVTKN